MFLKEGLSFNIKILDDVVNVRICGQVFNRETHEWSLGITYPDQMKVEISTLGYYGGQLSQTTIKKTLCHELVHCILDSGEYGDLSNNEALVEWIARNMYKLINDKHTVDIIKINK